MIKNFYIKKIIVCLMVMFSIFLLTLVPNDNLHIEEEIQYVNKDIETHNIYLLDSNNYLAKTKIMITSTSKKELATELIEALIIDSKIQDRIPNGFKSLINSNTKINNITIDENVIKIDFNEEILNTNIDIEEKIIESIVFTLTEIDNIDKVIIFINGEILSKLPKKNKTLPTTLDRSFGINKEYDISNKNNIYKTTVYYISEFNNNIYYVPVTKVNNDSRDKIEIIIDELSSSKTYTPNLMSYLNNNTKLVNTILEEDVLNIEFNEYIFNDINTKSILEEVIYTICYSIEDNYNVNTVSMSVNNEQIYKSVLKSIE